MTEKVWTIGYEKRDIEEFIGLLKGNGIEQVVDIRQNPFSRKKGFSRRTLCERLRSEGIAYQGIRGLGTPAGLRHDNTTLQEFMRRYREHFAKNQDLFQQAKDLVGQKPSALMCFERDPEICHRSVVAEALAKEGFEVEHIR